MAGRKENIKSLFSNTRTRVIIVFTAILLIFGIIIGYFKLRSSTEAPDGTASVAGAPGIQSIPGALNPTAEYAKLQENQNVNQAIKALESGSSAIPTLVRSQALGEGVTSVGSGRGGLGFTTLNRLEKEGTQQSLWIEDLQKQNCNKNAIQKVINEGGQMSDLKAGCTCLQLKNNGYALQDLIPICECSDLKAAGFSAYQLKEAGLNASTLRICGFSACEERAAGFTAQEMKDAGYTDGELKGTGFTDDEIAKASGLPDSITAKNVRDAGCDVQGLTKLRQSGVSAAAIRRISGCSAEQLKAAGFTAKDLRDAGFSAADLKRAGFTPEQLKAAGYDARDLLNAGFSPEELEKAGFTPADIKAAQAELLPGITSEDIRNGGCDVDSLKKERSAGVSATSIRRAAGCSAQALKSAGFSNSDLANAGFTPQEINAAVPLTDQEIKNAGSSPESLKKLLAAGVSAKQIRNLTGANAQALKNAGFRPKSLLDAGFTPQELLAAGFVAKQLEDPGVSPATMIAEGRIADCSLSSLKKAKAAGVSAKTIKQTMGCSAKALKDAGFTAKELKDAGFTAAELKNAGFDAKELKDAGFTAKELYDAGFTPQQLKDAGFSLKDLKNAGISAEALKNLGYTAAQLKAAGFSAKDLKSAGFSLDDLKKAGFTANDLKDAGFSATELKNAGFTANELKTAGFSPADLKSAGFSAAELIKAGYRTADLLNAGFTPEEVQLAGLGAPPTVGVPTAVTTQNVVGVTSTTPPDKATAEAMANNQQLKAILDRQNQAVAEQRYQQKIQQRTAEMISAANQSLQDWRKVSTQAYMPGEADKRGNAIVQTATARVVEKEVIVDELATASRVVLKTGDILFAVLDTSVNSDEPGPILATIVSGRLKGSKLIGSFNLPPNANKMVITFNSLSIPGALKTYNISAVAIDPNTARTALSSRTNHHYLMRYGSLFAASFLQGFGNAIQSANTAVTIGGTGGGNNITVQNGIGQSTLENAVIGLATVGKTWGQQAQQIVNRPTTVQVYSGTGIGILFTQDITI